MVVLIKYVRYKRPKDCYYCVLMQHKPINTKAEWIQCYPAEVFTKTLILARYGTANECEVMLLFDKTDSLNTTKLFALD